jgi:uncharacterized glyoxalase superfamily protein PhnB
MKLINLIPMLNVSNMEASLDFYERALGFRVVSPVEAVKEWRWATIRSGDTELMLSESQCDLGLKRGVDPQSDTNWPAIYYFYPDDVVALHAHVTRQGYSPTPLEVTFYEMNEFSLQDPDGHLLSFGQDTDKQPP